MHDSEPNDSLDAAVSDAARALTDVPVPDALRRGVRQQIQRNQPRSWRCSPAVAVAAIAAVVIVAVALWGRPVAEPRQDARTSQPAVPQDTQTSPPVQRVESGAPVYRQASASENVSTPPTVVAIPSAAPIEVPVHIDSSAMPLSVAAIAIEPLTDDVPAVPSGELMALQIEALAVAPLSLP